MLRIVIFLVVSSVFFLGTSFVLAQDASSPSANPRIGTSSAKRLEITTANMDAAKKRSIAEIDRRITSLTRALERLSTFKHLSSDQKTSLSAQVQEQINSLTALKEKISADTDVVVLRTDIQAIRDNHRIYAFFLPKIHLLAASDAMIEAANKGDEIADTLEERMGTLQTSGQDVASLQVTLADLRTNLDAARTQAQDVQSAVSALTVDGFPASKTILQEARTNLRAGRGNLETARSDARIIRDAIKAGRVPVGVRISTKSAVPSSRSAATSSAR